MSFELLTHIDIVMVETTLPANIGSAARAMMTAGLTQLILVNPKHPIDDTSYAHAKGGAPILDKAVIADSLDTALANHHLIFAASSRTRHLPRPVVSPSEAFVLMSHFVQNQPKPSSPSLAPPTPKIAILFGREAHGLNNEELSCAHYHLQIHANPDYPVLNIANSIQVIGSFIYHQLCETTQKASPPTTLNILPRQFWDEPAITYEQTDKLTTALLSLLTNLDLADEANLATLPNRLARLANRLQLDQKEYALLMALIYTLKKRLTRTL